MVVVDVVVVVVVVIVVNVHGRVVVVVPVLLSATSTNPPSFTPASASAPFGPRTTGCDSAGPWRRPSRLVGGALYRPERETVLVTAIELLVLGAGQGLQVVDAEVDAGDLFHTILAAMGLDSTENYQVGGRDNPIADPASSVIREVLA